MRQSIPEILESWDTLPFRSGINCYLSFKKFLEVLFEFLNFWEVPLTRANAAPIIILEAFAS